MKNTVVYIDNENKKYNQNNFASGNDVTPHDLM